MKILRMTIVIVFLVVLAAFSYVFVNEKLNADYTYPEITINEDMIDVSLSATHEELPHMTKRTATSPTRSLSSRYRSSSSRASVSLHTPYATATIT